MCLALGCLDESLYASADAQRDIVTRKSAPEKQFVHYRMSQEHPINKWHMNLFRVFACDTRAPGRLGRLAAGFWMKDMLNNILAEGIFYYESEMIAVVNVALSSKNILNSKSSIREDKRTI